MYKSANKVSDENLSPPYHFNILCIQPNTEASPWQTLGSLIKSPDDIHPECSRLSMTADCVQVGSSTREYRNPCGVGHSDMNPYT